jgi:glucose/mannose-6-phosphate isomerase
MLDNLKLFHEKDTVDTLGATERQYEQLVQKTTVSGRKNFDSVHNVVYAGMGGSALAALFVQVWPGLSEPFEIVRGYDLPGYVAQDTLVIAASVSGNTEETLSALAQAEVKGAQIAVITGGGELRRIAEQKGYLQVSIPKMAYSRGNMLTTFRLLLQVLDTAGILKRNYQSELEKAAGFLHAASQHWRPDVPTAQNKAKQIAQELLGRSIVVYSGPRLYPAAYKWKVDFNENAKQVAWANQYPEFNHNEFSGWSKQPVDKPYAVVELRSGLENPRIQKRFELSERLLSGMRPAPIIIDVEGEDLLEQLLWSTMLGDFVSLYLAFASGVNPIPLPLVDKLKDALNKIGS